MALQVVGLGPGPKAFLSPMAQQALAAAHKVFLQSDFYPVTQTVRELAADLECLDTCYQSAEDFDSLNQAIAARVADTAALQQTVFAVIGSGTEGQSAVSAVLQACRARDIEISFVSGISLGAAALAAAGISADSGFCSHFGLPDMLRIDPALPQVICDLNSPLQASECKLQLLDLYPDEHEVFLVSVQGDALISRAMPLCEIDHGMPYDVCTSLAVPALPFESRTRYTVADLVDICRMLREPDGCPWDREQTHESLKQHLVEECFETLAAIDEDDPDHVCEELGDVLLQVALHSRIAQELGDFTIHDVSSAECAKMIRRHPHVFGNVHADTAEDVLTNWDAIKEQERGGAPKSLLDGAAEGMPAMIRAQKLQSRARKIGFDFADAKEAAGKVTEELAELLAADAEIEEEAGDLLFAAVNVVRMLGIHADTALARANEKFSRRFRRMEQLAIQQGLDLKTCNINEMNALWDRIKQEES